MDGATALELWRALEEQVWELERVLTRLDDTRLLLPADTADDWRGLAHLFYSWALDALRTDLNTAQEQLAAAVRETRRATGGPGGRGR
ncbi:hypothetical protein [Parafrigoribacterium humi]|uniref:hypothetical protein n=1 Tax=Parafrigoribacterium humi TaxID=3144664 RepID=UPI0032EE6C59